MREVSRLFLVPTAAAFCWQLIGGLTEGWSFLRLVLLATCVAVLLWSIALPRGGHPGVASRVLASACAAVLVWVTALELWLFIDKPFALGVLFFGSGTIVHGTVLVAATRPRESKSRADRLMLLLGFSSSVAAVSLLAVEAILRLFFPIHMYEPVADDPSSPGMYITAENGLRVPRPGWRGESRHPEFPGIRIEINDWGLRDGLDEASPPTAADASVLVLGDSMIFGTGVALEDTCHEVLEGLAAEITPRPLRVYGGGVPGFGTLHERQMLDLLAPLLQPGPDVVVLGLLEDNDFQDNWALERGEFPTFEHHDDTSPLARYLEAIGRFHFWAGSCLIVQKTRAEMMLVGMGLLKPIVRRNLFLDMCLKSEPPPLVHDMANRVVHQLGKINERCGELGAKLAVMVIPSVIQTEPDRFDDFVQELGADSTAYARTAFHDAFVSRLRTAGFSVVDTLPALQASAANGATGYHLDGHWNATGHGVAAKLLVPTLAELLR